MVFTIDREVLTVNSRYAWVPWIFHAIFLLVFLPGILAMWHAGPETIPLLFNLAFTGLFLAAAPFMLDEIAKARLVRGKFDRIGGTVNLIKQGLVTRREFARTFDDIDRIEMRTSDNDGEFHTPLVVFRDGEEFAFSHGNYRQGME